MARTAPRSFSDARATHYTHDVPCKSVSFDCEAEGARCILEHVQFEHRLDLELLNVCASDAASTVALDVLKNPGLCSERVTLDDFGQSPKLESDK
jgi:hypothetical protein